MQVRNFKTIAKYIPVAIMVFSSVVLPVLQSKELLSAEVLQCAVVYEPLGIVVAVFYFKHDTEVFQCRTM